MDASFAQSAIVWLALGIGLISVLVCVFSAAAPQAEEEGCGSAGRDQAPAFEADAAASFMLPSDSRSTS